MKDELDLDGLERAAKEWQERGWNGGDIGAVDVLQLIAEVRRLQEWDGHYCTQSNS